jgi:hypothetical protein
VLSCDERDAHPRQIGLLDDPDFLLRCPAPPALDTGEHLAMGVATRITGGHMPHTYQSARPCQAI